ncbi:MAG: hypothetical protein KUG77_18575, partial [Nannocystaceae bacterium]|nr:hypothetical protein [Nannocystaceae bacterium]
IAALMGSAVVASGRDVASSWYNPALLTHNDRLRADVSAAAYGVRWIRARRGLQLRDENEQQTAAIRSREFLVVPTAFALGSAVSERVSLGFGFFTPRFAEPTVIVRGGGEASDAFAAELRRSGIQRRYYAGPIFGLRIHEDLDLGLALYGVYDKSVVSERVFVEHDSDAGRSTILADSEETVRSYGVQAAFGLRGWLSEWVSAGASLRTPSIVMFQRVEGSRVAVESEIDPQGVARTTSDFEGFPIQRRPTQISTWSVASGISVGRTRWRLGLDAEASPAHYPGIPTIGRAAHWNVRLGIRWKLDDRWSVGGGVFTDRNDSRGTSFGSVRVDLVGAALGVRLRTPVKLDDDERAARIAFQTTIGVRYSAGRGRAGGVEGVYAGEGISPDRLDFARSVGATMHLLTVHVGSGLVF